MVVCIRKRSLVDMLFNLPVLTKCYQEKRCTAKKNKTEAVSKARTGGLKTSESQSIQLQPQTVERHCAIAMAYQSLSVLLLMTIFAQALFALVRSNFVTFTFFSARHNAAVCMLKNDENNYCCLHNLVNSVVLSALPSPS